MTFDLLLTHKITTHCTKMKQKIRFHYKEGPVLSYIFARRAMRNNGQNESWRESQTRKASEFGELIFR